MPTIKGGEVMRMTEMSVPGGKNASGISHKRYDGRGVDGWWIIDILMLDVSREIRRARSGGYGDRHFDVGCQ